MFEAGQSDEAWFACGPTTATPRLLWTVPRAYGRFAVTTKLGDKVVFEGDGWGEGGGENTFVGWFDARTSEVRLGELAGGVSNKPYEVALAADGSLGLLVGYEEGGGGLRVGYLGMSSTAGKLLPELVLATPGLRAPGSLAFADGDRALTWALDGGGARTVPVGGERVTCTSGTTLLDEGGARVFEVFPNRKTSRGFQVDMLAACSRGDVSPRQLAVSDVYDQHHWGLPKLNRVGAKVAFQVGGRGIVLMDAGSGQVQFVRPRGLSFVNAVGISASGVVVFDGLETSDGTSRRFVGRLTDTDGGWAWLAPAGGTPELDSFTVDGERVRWRVEGGRPQSVPVLGETAVTCESGVTLVDRDGLRVFELLPAGAKRARLVACFGGTPTTLLTGPRRASWQTHELARERGRVVLHATAEGHFDWDHVLSVGPNGAHVTQSENDTVAPGDVRDVAVAPDGRVALAIGAGRRWRVLVYGRRERVVARPRDGVRAGTLRFAGTRVVWRNRGGRARGA